MLSPATIKTNNYIQRDLDEMEKKYSLNILPYSSLDDDSFDVQSKSNKYTGSQGLQADPGVQLMVAKRQLD